MVIVGVILLLPSLCALIFGADTLLESHPDPTVLTLVTLDLLAAAGGIFLIRAAIRGPPGLRAHRNRPLAAKFICLTENRSTKTPTNH
jgi:hypothetical protein